MTTLSVADVLDRAADLIEPEGAWTQGGAGRDARGNLVDPANINRAVCFCAVGAIWKINGGKTPANCDFVMGECFPPVHTALNRHHGIGDWNDAPGRTQPEVVAKLREAATLSRSSENRNG